MTEISQPEGYSEINYAREGVKIGFLNGAFALLIMFGTYYMGFEAFFNVTTASKFIPYMIIIILIQGFRLRKQAGGYLTFQEGLKFAFTSYIIAEIILAIGTYILFNVMDPGLTMRVAEEAIERNADMFESIGKDPSDLKEQVQQSARETSIRNVIVGMGGYLLFDFILSLLISLVIRREKPIF